MTEGNQNKLRVKTPAGMKQFRGKQEDLNQEINGKLSEY